MALFGHQVNLGHRVAAAEVVGYGDPGNAVADDHHRVHAGVAGCPAHHGTAELLRPLRLEGHRDIAEHAGNAGHAGIGGKAQPLQRVALVIVDRGAVAETIEHGHRVRPADAHPAAGLDAQAVLLDHFQEGAALFHHHLLFLVGKAHLGLTEATGPASGDGAGGSHRQHRQGGLLLGGKLTFLGEHPPHPPQGERQHHRPQRPHDNIRHGQVSGGEHAGDGEPVVQEQRRRAETGGNRCGTAAKADIERPVQTRSRQHGQREAAVHLHSGDGGRAGHGIKGEDHAGKSAGKEAAQSGVAAVLILHVGEVGDAGVEVVAVLGAADTGLTVAVGNDDKGLLTVQPLHGKQRTDAGTTPATLALEHQPTGEGRAQRRHEEQGGSWSVVVEQRLAGGHSDEEDRQADDDAVFAQPPGQRHPAREAEQPRRLVEGGHRADVAPQPRRDEEEQRQHRQHEAPPDGERQLGHDQQRHNQRQRCRYTEQPQQVPNPQRHRLPHLRVIREEHRRRHHPHPRSSVERSVARDETNRRQNAERTKMKSVALTSRVTGHRLPHAPLGLRACTPPTSSDTH